MVVMNANVNEFHFAAAAAGGVTAPSALVQVALAAHLWGEGLEGALAMPRLHHGGEPDQIYFEPEVPRSVRDGLRARGHSIARTRALGRVNAIRCAGGLPPKPETCLAAADPRGFGLAVASEE